MLCQQFGQQQASGEMRFCSRCGFPLGVITQVLAQGGVLTTLDAERQGRKMMSPRQRGLRQGAMLMLSTMLIVPVIVFIVILTDFDPLIPLIPLSAVVCFVGGLLRIVYALMFEADESHAAPIVAAPFAPAQLNAHMRGTALPPAQQDMPIADWRRRPDTSEIVQPPSVTENTTKLLKKETEEQGGTKG